MPRVMSLYACVHSCLCQHLPVSVTLLLLLFAFAFTTSSNISSVYFVQKQKSSRIYHVRPTTRHLSRHPLQHTEALDLSHNCSTCSQPQPHLRLSCNIGKSHVHPTCLIQAVFFVAIFFRLFPSTLFFQFNYSCEICSCHSRDLWRFCAINTDLSTRYLYTLLLLLQRQ